MFFKKIATYDKIKFPQQANSMVGGTRRNCAYDIFFANQTENYINFNPTSTKIAKSHFFKKVDIRQNRTNLAISSVIHFDQLIFFFLFFPSCSYFSLKNLYYSIVFFLMYAHFTPPPPLLPH